jgi:hypothetical protein
MKFTPFFILIFFSVAYFIRIDETWKSQVFNSNNKPISSTYAYPKHNTDSPSELTVSKSSEIIYDEYPSGIAVDNIGNVYVVGETRSRDFPTTNGAFDESYNGGDCDIFVAKFNPSGSNLIYSTLIGGSGSDGAYEMAVDDSGNVYVIGYTSIYLHE